MSSDSDIIFPPHYLSEAFALLGRKPLSVAYSQCWDLSAEVTASLHKDPEAITFDRLVTAAAPRSSGDCNAGINMTYARFYRWLRGYDEFYEGWGSEDNDLQRRFELFGLRSRSLKPQAVYLHQWHPKGLGVEDFQGVVRRNDDYFNRAESIFRNAGGWGEVPSARTR